MPASLKQIEKEVRYVIRWAQQHRAICYSSLVDWEQAGMLALFRAWETYQEQRKDRFSWHVRYQLRSRRNNECMAARRRHARIPTVHIPEEIFADSVACGDSAGWPTRFMELIEGLPLSSQQLVIDRYVYGYEVSEMARRAGINRRTMGNRIEKIIVRLRKQLLSIESSEGE